MSTTRAKCCSVSAPARTRSGTRFLTRGPADVLDHAAAELAVGTKMGIDATRKLPGEGFKRPWPPLIKMDPAVKAKIQRLFNG